MQGALELAAEQAVACLGVLDERGVERVQPVDGDVVAGNLADMGIRRGSQLAVGDGERLGQGQS